MKRNIIKISVTFLFAALILLTVSSAQATESIWFSGHEQYRPATIVLNDGTCYSAANNNENIFLAPAFGMNQEADGGICSLTDGRSYSIWLQAINP